MIPLVQLNRGDGVLAMLLLSSSSFSSSSSIRRLPTTPKLKRKWSATVCGVVSRRREEEEVKVKVTELDELPEQWRRTKVAWLCKELPSHKHSTLTRLLNAQRKWITQDDVSYIIVHCLRIRENDSAFRVYTWMIRQHWYRFDFALVTKLAECFGKDRKFSKCRQVFDDIIKQGQLPTESTFHVLIVAYLSSASVDGCLDQACQIYNRMLQFGGYNPLLSLHNSLFRALVSGQGVASKKYLNQAELIFHKLKTTRLEIQKDIYARLIWLHSYQDVVDGERIEALRNQMQAAGFHEEKDVLVSVMRACSKSRDVDKFENAWNKIIELGPQLPSQALVYRMELYAKIGQPLKSLEVFRDMRNHGISPNVVAYQKIIEVMTEAREIELSEMLITEFASSGLKPLTPSFIALMDMYLNMDMHDKVEVAFSRCSPNRTAYTIYLDSLVRNLRFELAEEVFYQMHMNGAIGTDERSCNIILAGFIASEEYGKVEKIFKIMRQKKYEIEPAHIEKLNSVISYKNKFVEEPVRLKLDQEQREILIGLLLGGVQVIEPDEHGRRNHAIHFEFCENSSIHSVLKVHIHERYHEWLGSSDRKSDGECDIKREFSTVPHVAFDFFAEKFWKKGKFVVPKLIHRWMSERVLAYWYMYGGLQTSSGDAVLRLKVGSRDDVERIVKCFLIKSLDCRVKRKGKTVWIGFQGDKAVSFWNLVEPYVLENVKEFMEPKLDDQENGNSSGCQFEDLDEESNAN